MITVAARDVPAVFEYVAQTQRSRQVNIQARVDGFLDKRVYTEGSIVKAGQVLFLMDMKPFQAQVDAAKAQVSKSQAALDVAKQNLDRVKPLAQAEALSQKDLDDATGNYESAAASVEASKAQLTTAQLNLSYCTITSPVDGISGAAAQADGTYLNQTNSQLTTVTVLSPMWVNFSLSENEYQSLRDQVDKGLLRRAPNGSYCATGGREPVSRGAEPGVHARATLQLPGEHLSGDGRRLGGASRCAGAAAVRRGAAAA